MCWPRPPGRRQGCREAEAGRERPAQRAVRVHVRELHQGAVEPVCVCRRAGRGREPSGAYNPLFIYGPSGLGKTHLLNAIKIEIQKNHPDFNIVYVDCEKFTNETITAIKTATMEQFRQRYRKADVLFDRRHPVPGRQRRARRRSFSTPSTRCTTMAARSSSRRTAPRRRSNPWRSVCAPGLSGA